MFEFLGHKWGEPTLGTPSGTISWNADLTGLDPAGDATIAQLETALQSAFTAWENVSAVEFVEVSGPADVVIGETTFGPGSATLAVATISDLSNFTEPTVANIQFNADIPWAPMTDPDVVSENFFAVALHEIGHILGLEHVDDPTQIMNAFLTTDNLGEGDIQGIQALYGTDSGDVAIEIDQDELDDAVDDVTSGRTLGGGGDGSGGGGVIGALLLGLVALIAGVFTGGAGGLAVVAASRAMDDGEDETTDEVLTHGLFTEGAGHCGHADCGEFCSHHEHDHEHDHAHAHFDDGHCGHADCGEICLHSNDESDELVLDETNFLPMIPVEEFAQTEDAFENDDELFLL